MGIDTNSCLIWGVEHKELPEKLREDYDALEGELDQASPYYDSGRDNRIYGVAIAYSGDYRSKDITEVNDVPIQDAIENAKVEFKKRTGLRGRLYLSPDIT